MRDRIGLIAALAMTVAVSQGCGSSNNNAPDGGNGGTGKPDASSGDSGPAEGACGPLPGGTQLFPSSTAAVTIAGVTSDGYAIFAGTGTTVLYYVPLDTTKGGHQMIGLVDGNIDVFVQGKIVGYADTNSGRTNLANLWLWSFGGANVDISHGLYNFSPPGQGSVDISSDGTHVLYIESTDSGMTGTLTYEGIDGTGKTALVSNVDLTNNNCQPYTYLAGSTILVSYCNPPPPASPDAGAGDDGGTDGGTPSLNVATIAAYAVGSTTPITVATNVQSYFSFDKAGSHVLALGATGLSVYGTAAAGAGTLIDAAGTIGSFSADGSAVIYTTTPGNVLMRSPITGSPTTLAPMISAIAAVSPDTNWALGQLNPGNNTTDLYLASTVTAGTPTALSAMPTAALNGSPFTDDSNYALFLANNSRSMGNEYGDLMLAPTAGGTPVKSTSATYTAFGATGSKVVAAANYASGGQNYNGIADIVWFDATNPSAVTTLTTSADADFFLTAAKDQVVYAWTCAKNGAAGIYVVPIK